jgi:hypothetical protein
MVFVDFPVVAYVALFLLDFYQKLFIYCATIGSKTTLKLEGKFNKIPFIHGLYFTISPIFKIEEI